MAALHKEGTKAYVIRWRFRDRPRQEEQSEFALGSILHGVRTLSGANSPRSAIRPPTTWRSCYGNGINANPGSTAVPPFAFTVITRDGSWKR